MSSNSAIAIAAGFVGWCSAKLLSRPKNNKNNNSSSSNSNSGIKGRDSNECKDYENKIKEIVNKDKGIEEQQRDYILSQVKEAIDKRMCYNDDGQFNPLYVNLELGYGIYDTSDPVLPSVYHLCSVKNRPSCCSCPGAKEHMCCKHCRGHYDIPMVRTALYSSNNLEDVVDKYIEVIQ